MKKKLLLLFLPILMLTGCNNSSGGAIPVKERETVNLSADNYSKYIAVYTFSDTYYSGNAYSIYHYHLEGSPLCKFVDCTITYTFANDSGATQQNVSYQISLTISGSGESKEVSKRIGQAGFYQFTVLSASGTVEILY